jgi:hypothetical protein
MKINVNYPKIHFLLFAILTVSCKTEDPDPVSNYITDTVNYDWGLVNNTFEKLPDYLNGSSAMRFWDTSNGVFLAGGGNIFETTSGGRSWDLITTLPPLKMMFYKSPTEWYGLGVISNELYGYYSSDGGQTWINVFLDPNGSKWWSGPLLLYFFSDTEIFFENRYTTNSGQTWDTANYDILAGNLYPTSFLGFFAADQNKGVAVSWDMGIYSIFTTENKGRDWVKGFEIHDTGISNLGKFFSLPHIGDFSGNNFAVFQISNGPNGDYTTGVFNISEDYGKSFTEFKINSPLPEGVFSTGLKFQLISSTRGIISNGSHDKTYEFNLLPITPLLLQTVQVCNSLKCKKDSVGKSWPVSFTPIVNGYSFGTVSTIDNKGFEKSILVKINFNN